MDGTIVGIFCYLKRDQIDPPWLRIIGNYSKTNPTLFPADHITFSTNSCTFIVMHWIQVTSALIFLCQLAMKFFLDTFFIRWAKKDFLYLLCPV